MPLVFSKFPDVFGRLLLALSWHLVSPTSRGLICKKKSGNHTFEFNDTFRVHWGVRASLVDATSYQ